MVAFWAITDIWKEGHFLFNDAFNTFYLRLYGVRDMVKDHSDSEKGNQLPPRGPFLDVDHSNILCINRYMAGL